MSQTYKVTIHEHVIYDYVIDAESREEAIARAEDSIVSEEKHLWREDTNAGWIDIGAVYNDVGEEI